MQGHSLMSFHYRGTMSSKWIVTVCKCRETRECSVLSPSGWLLEQPIWLWGGKNSHLANVLPTYRSTMQQGSHWLCLHSDLLIHQQYQEKMPLLLQTTWHPEWSSIVFRELILITKYGINSSEVISCALMKDILRTLLHSTVSLVSQSCSLSPSLDNSGHSCLKDHISLVMHVSHFNSHFHARTSFHLYGM